MAIEKSRICIENKINYMIYKKRETKCESKFRFRENNQLNLKNSTSQLIRSFKEMPSSTKGIDKRLYIIIVVV